MKNLNLITFCIFPIALLVATIFVGVKASERNSEGLTFLCLALLMFTIYAGASLMSTLEKYLKSADSKAEINPEKKSG